MLVERTDLIFRAEIQEDRDMLIAIRVGEKPENWSVGFGVLSIEEQRELYKILKQNLEKEL
jgi:hypothetical protein